MSIFGIVASENPDGLERTFDFIRDAGFSISEAETGLFGLPDGLGWAILQMAIIMVIIFAVILLISYLVFLVRKRQYKKNQLMKEDEKLSITEDDKEENDTCNEIREDAVPGKT